MPQYSTNTGKKLEDEPATAPVLRVFIADDSAAVADMLTQLLTAPGSVEVVGVGGTEGGVIAAVAESRPDVVVLDLQLADGSGTNVIRAVRSDPAMAATVILVTSNHDSPQLRAGCLALGANGYFDKVKELTQLAQALASCAEAKRLRGS